MCRDYHSRTQRGLESYGPMEYLTCVDNIMFNRPRRGSGRLSFTDNSGHRWIKIAGKENEVGIRQDPKTRLFPNHTSPESPKLQNSSTVSPTLFSRSSHFSITDSEPINQPPSPPVLHSVQVMAIGW